LVRELVQYGWQVSDRAARRHPPRRKAASRNTGIRHRCTHVSAASPTGHSPQSSSIRRPVMSVCTRPGRGTPDTTAAPRKAAGAPATSPLPTDSDERGPAWRARSPCNSRGSSRTVAHKEGPGHASSVKGGVRAGAQLAIASDDRCRSYVKRLPLFAVIGARVPGSVGGGHAAVGLVRPQLGVANGYFGGLCRERRVVSPFAALERGRSTDRSGESGRRGASGRMG
jgi:hypothetical protein